VSPESIASSSSCKPIYSTKPIILRPGSSHQSRAIDNQRFKRKLKKLPKPILREVKDKLRQLAEL
jgi:hypothetical protein